MILFCVIVPNLAAYAENGNFRNDSTFEAKTNKSFVRVAETFDLELKVLVPAGSKVFFPPIADTLGKFDVVEVTDIFDIPSDSKGSVSMGPNGERRVWIRRITLESILTGDLTIPSLEIRVSQGSEVEILKSESISIQIVSVLEDRADPTKIRDIQSFVDLSVPKSSSKAWLWWALGGGTVFVLGFISVCFFVKRKKWLSPKQWATAEIGRLNQAVNSRNSNSTNKGTNNSASVNKITTVLRRFLAIEFGLPASSFTTSDLRENTVLQDQVSPSVLARYQDLLELADQTKFAGLQLNDKDLQLAIEEALDLINITSNQVVPFLKSHSMENQ